MAIYIMDKNTANTAAVYAKMDKNAKVFLIQDGLYTSPEIFEGLKVFVFAEEVQERGLEASLPASFERVDYSEGIDIMVDEKIFSFC